MSPQRGNKYLEIWTAKALISSQQKVKETSSKYGNEQTGPKVKLFQYKLYVSCHFVRGPQKHLHT